MAKKTYDEREHCLAFKRLPGATAEWIVSALTRRLTIDEAPIDLLRHLTDTTPVDCDGDTVLEDFTNCSTSDTSVI